MKHFTTIILVALATFNVLAQEDIKRDDENLKIGLQYAETYSLLEIPME